MVAASLRQYRVNDASRAIQVDTEKVGSSESAFFFFVPDIRGGRRDSDSSGPR
jgi:hypothetical protein